jgi:signal peptidase II
MTARKNADIFKLAYLSLILLPILQLIDFLAVKCLQYSLNQRLIFGLIGNNLTAYFLALAILIILIYLFWKKIVGIEAVFILAGLLSNVLDRIIYGGAVDYLSLFSIPKFNLADVCIIAGSLMLAYKFIFFSK